jgi:hypothetical protein
MSVSKLTFNDFAVYPGKRLKTGERDFGFCGAMHYKAIVDYFGIRISCLFDVSLEELAKTRLPCRHKPEQVRPLQVMQENRTVVCGLLRNNRTDFNVPVFTSPKPRATIAKSALPNRLPRLRTARGHG